ncbi:hypothetical protein GKZ68_13115 [Hymenobacter sp. BRD128]|uniref:hypothetical protein n=1 Tax=Hymenobacter sp. BRD128 TaxID=2675878 RepID=UPI0015633892|nr:hypothetical protein [Hymenobacter sp. BRD128]QKG57482.1 hypothetical protein GKZ68_13115 [Hymenobacter sp. BRD128]
MDTHYPSFSPHSAPATQYNQATDFWQERDFGQKFSAVFEFLRVHWRPLGRVLLYLVGPLALVQALIVVLLQYRLFSTLGGFGRSSSPYAIGHSYGLSVFQFFTSPTYFGSLLLGAAFYSVLVLTVYGYLLECLYPTRPGQPIGVAQVWAIVKRQFIGTYFSLFGLSLLVVAGSFVFFIPGLYLSVALSLFFIVHLVEGGDFAATISRCLSLIKGKWWSTFGLIFMILLLAGLLLRGAGIILGLVGAGLAGAGLLGGLGHTMLNLPVLSAVLGVLSTLAALLIYPLLLLAIAFQYFNLVERREGVGLRTLIQQLGQPAPTAPDHATYRPHEEGEY